MDLFTPSASVRQTAGRAVIAAGCVYEVVALIVPRVPTITAIIQRSSRLPWVGRVALWLWLGFVADHFVERSAA
jgi:hypothetical protein